MDRVSLSVNLSDPYEWNVDAVRRWCEWTARQYQLPLTDIRGLHMDGATLCMLGEADFRERCGESWQYLFAQLEFWKNGKIHDS